jgi:hypothetical protein
MISKNKINLAIFDATAKKLRPPEYSIVRMRVPALARPKLSESF